MILFTDFQQRGLLVGSPNSSLLGPLVKNTHFLEYHNKLKRLRYSHPSSGIF